MQLRFSTLLLALGLCWAQSGFAANDCTTALPQLDAATSALTQQTGFTSDDFLALTPKKVREMTGEKLGIKGALALKVAQKQVRKAQRASSGRAADIPQGLYVVLVIFGWGWLAMGLMDDFEGNNWWLNLILTLLCFIPGLIHGFIKMSDYY